MREAVGAYFHLLLAYLECLGLIVFGWYLAHHSEDIVSFFNDARSAKSALRSKILAICGWISFGAGCLIGVFAIIFSVVALISAL